MIALPLQLCTGEIESLTWGEVLYGFSHRFLGWRSCVELASRRVEEGSSNPLEIELAAVGKDQDWKVGDLLSKLSGSEPRTDEVSHQKRWLFIILKWLYEHRGTFEDPLGEVEEIYADFHYPDEISNFVRFLPPKGDYKPAEHTREENIQRLFRLWSDYLQANR
jgi:hypothetical protein